MSTVASENQRATVFVQAESITAITYANRQFIGSDSALSFANCTNADKASKTERKFRELHQKWKDAISGMSSMSQMVSNKYYLRIIAMGEKVIPFILNQLRTQSAPWFAALRALTEREDIGREHAGNFRKIADEWIAWGQQEGHI